MQQQRGPCRALRWNEDESRTAPNYLRIALIVLTDHAAPARDRVVENPLLVLEGISAGLLRRL